MADIFVGSRGINKIVNLDGFLTMEDKLYTTFSMIGITSAIKNVDYFLLELNDWLELYLWESEL